jgi:hypothetical protein
MAKTSSGVTDICQNIHIKLTEKYEHFVQAIHGYRETERLRWNPQNTSILQRVRDIAFPPGTPQLSLVHLLDISADGVIKPHIDSVRVSLYLRLMVGRNHQANWHLNFIMRWQNLLIALYILELLPDVVVSAQYGGLRRSTGTHIVYSENFIISFLTKVNF